MTSHPKIYDVQCLLQLYHGDMITENECLVRIEERLMAGKIERLRQGKWVANWSFGCGTGEAAHTYALMDHNDWEQWYYPFTLLNVVRFFWNRAMRWLGWYRWESLGLKR